MLVVGLGDETQARETLEGIIQHYFGRENDSSVLLGCLLGLDDGPVNRPPPCSEALPRGFLAASSSSHYGGAVSVYVKLLDP